MSDPGQPIPEPGRSAGPGTDLAFPPLGRPDPGPLAKGGGAAPDVRAERPPAFPPPRAMPAARSATGPGRPDEGRAGSSHGRLALVVLVLAIGGAALALAQEPRAWRLGREGWPFASTDRPLATHHPGPPPSPVALEALSRIATPAEQGGLPLNQRLRQLTLEPCCAGSWWSADSGSLLYIDRPEGQAEASLFRLPIWPPGALPEPAGVDTPGAGGGQPRFAARPEGEVSVVQDLTTGSEWQLPTGGNPTLIAPDGSAAAWFTGNGGREEVDGFNRFVTAKLDGTEQRELGGLWGGSLVRFLPDGRHLLALGRPQAGRARYELQRIDLSTGTVGTLAAGMWLSEVALSPSGAWVAYLVSLDREDPAANGVWVAPTEPGSLAPRRLELHGAYRWRDDNRLVFVPQLPGAVGHAILEYDALGGRSRVLVDPARLPLRIADNDWSVSPDGKRLAFRAEEDRTLWLLDLPE